VSDAIALAVIGGSGVYDFPSLQDVRKIEMDTPFGQPSSPIRVGKIDGNGIAFVARHGDGHTLTPSEVPYRANIFALKSIGVERIVSISACGSLRQELEPGHFVIPDQLFDHTQDRARTFFGEGLVAHLSTPNPLCPDLSSELAAAARSVGGSVHTGGTHITIEGPRFSTKAESGVYRSWGMSLIGMTAAPEAFLAREAEMCYAMLAHVTDYDVWHENATPVSVELVARTLRQNATLAERAILELLKRLPFERACECPDALASAMLTPATEIPDVVRRKLAPIVGKYLPT